MLARWYVGTTRPQQEFVAASALRAGGFTVFLPCSRYWVRPRFKLLRRQRCTAALFPGYLFVQFDPDSGCWFEWVYRANGMRAVLRDVDGIPSPVPANVIETLQKAEQAGDFDYTRSRPRFHAGDVVEIRSGPLMGLVGKIRKASSRDRVQPAGRRPGGRDRRPRPGHGAMITAGKLIALDRRVSADDLEARLVERDQRLATDARSEIERWLGDRPFNRCALAQRTRTD